MRLTRRLVLASASPRRRELLERFGLSFDVIPARVDEDIRPGESAAGLVARLAAEKARAVHRQVPLALVAAGDTVVVLDDAVLGKPEGPAQGAAMLGRLSGRTHRVLTGYYLLDGVSDAEVARTIETSVTFRNLTPEWMRWYSAQPEASGKAGGYAIQGMGGAMVTRIEGSYTNVMGFPVEFVIWDLLEHGWVEL
jgi:septum formation protein